MRRINVRATVDVIGGEFPFAVGLQRYRVECWGEQPFDYCRTYEIREKTDNLAAQEGIRRFTEEMERLFPEQDD